MGWIFKVFWVLLMVFIVSPAFYVAGYTEGAALHEARYVAEQVMEVYSFGNETIASIWAVPVSIVSMIFPSTAAIALLPGMLIGNQEWFGVVFITLFFLSTYYPLFLDRKRSKRQVTIAEEAKAAGLNL